MKKTIINIFAAVLFFAAGTIIIYAYSNYEDCRCNQSVPGVDLNICCALKAGTDKVWTGGGAQWSTSYCKTPCSSLNCSGSTPIKTGNAYQEDSGGCCKGEDCSSYKCTAGSGGWVPAADASNYCKSCCGSNNFNFNGTVTCGGVSYINCNCRTIVAATYWVRDFKGFGAPQGNCTDTCDAVKRQLNRQGGAAVGGVAADYLDMCPSYVDPSKQIDCGLAMPHITTQPAGTVEVCYLPYDSCDTDVADPAGGLCYQGDRFYLGCKVIK
ncbi:MAG: hypothetical protein LBI01_03425 [Elusimicrobium sp.]|nr:hypothetical protein [Elusimicrobium sp.]